tara:strand:+ start:87 stop:1115 length:1029 start_codon:yes stop_codon:yes gene_type:complete
MRLNRASFLLFFVFAFLKDSLYAQVSGESVYQFLNISNSPRQLALGGKVITINDDVTFGSYNPSSINQDMDNMLGVNYYSYFSDISYGSLSYAYRLDNRGNTIHFGFSYINYGDFIGYDENGNSTSDFTGNESVLSIGYANKFKNLPIKYGINSKLITSTLEQYNSYGIAFDLGFFYENKLNSLKASVVFRNIGFQLKPYNELNESLPFEIDFGISQKLQNAPISWHLTLENLQKWPIGISNPSRIITDLDGNISEEKISFFNEVLRHVIIGLELFPKSIFTIQLGYSFRRSEELRILDQRNFSGVSFGFGMKFNKLRFNYCHARLSSAVNVNYFGIQLYLD